MWKYFKYLKYVFIHKYYIYKAGRKLNVSRWQLIKHDLSKFLPSELIPYTTYFYGENGGVHRAKNAGKCYIAGDDYDFDLAWLKHIHRNAHHWQFYLLLEGNTVKAIKMPDKYAREMVADWSGAGRTQGFTDTKKWYNENKDKMFLHDITRKYVEELLLKL